MPGVSEEQIAAARQMTAIEFLQRYRPGELVKAESRGEFQLRAHDSFKINEETSFWHWKSRDIGGKSALDYLIKVEGMKFVDAVLALCDECPGYILPSPQPKKRPEFILPPAAVNNRRVFAYLLKRGISRGVIEACVRAGILYESADYHNAVFVGTDEHSVPRHAQKRSTNSCGRAIKLNVEGSEARYSFHHLGDDGDLYVFEAPIDLLSYLTLHPENWQHHSYVACCGTSYEPVRWMLRQMETPQMVSLCLDHDRAGERGSERMAEQIASEFGIPTRRLISEQKDWNEDLCAMQEHPKQGMEMKMR